MENSIKEIINLTDEYAANLNCALVDFSAQEYLYIDLFNRIFQNCIFIQSDTINLEKLKMPETIDLVFISINDNCECQKYSELKRKIDAFRFNDDTIPVIALNNVKHNHNIEDLLKGSYVVDGILPSPFYKYGLYRYLYRLLKRITHLKDLESYIHSLEQELSFEAPKELHLKPVQNEKTQTLDKEREKDIRFTQHEKISAVDFMASLDDTVTDKMEQMLEHLDNFLLTLYDFETYDVEQAYALLPKISVEINEIYIIIDALSVFSVTARAFQSLNELLNRLTIENIANASNKDTFSMMLIAIVNDLEKWIKVIFIDISTQNIHYFDASFSSNILEIENIFVETDDEDEDFDDDLEFF